MSARRPLPRLHLVTDDHLLAAPDFEKRAAELLQAGRERLALHLRGPRTSGHRLYQLAALLVVEAAAGGSMLLVNDRLDVALASGADGVQLGARGLPVAVARRLLGKDRWIGRSAHGVGEARAALEEGVDFLLAGTLYASGSHPGRAGSGTGWLREIPGGGERVIGIGGIGRGRVGEVRAAPAHGVAVIRAIWEAPDPVEELLRFMDVLYEGDASE